MKALRNIRFIAAIGLTTLFVGACNTAQEPRPASIEAEQATVAPRQVSGAVQPPVFANMKAMMQIRAPSLVPAVEIQNRENYAHLDENGVKVTADTPVSTFSIDVDTASYSNVRRMLNDGYLPVRDAVRVEELINYFSYNYAIPKNLDTPFSINTEVAPSPWNKDRVLLQIGLQGYKVDRSAMPAANLVFLLDVSTIELADDDRCLEA